MEVQKHFQCHHYLGKLTEITRENSLAYAITYFEKMAIVINETKIGSNGKPKYGTFAVLGTTSICIKRITRTNIIIKY